MAAILFLLASALALASAASPSPGLQCTTASYGIRLGSPLRLADIKLPAGFRAYTFVIPIGACPVNKRAVGTLVQVCDPEGPPAPKVRLESLSEGVVVRKTRAVLPATVSSAVYCARGLRDGTLGDADRSFRVVATPTDV